MKGSRLVVVGVALLLPSACGGSPSRPSAGSADGPIPHASQSTIDGSPTPIPTSPAVARCKTGALRVRAGRESDGTSFAASADVEIANRGNVPCRLGGVPTVSIIRQSATRLRVKYVVPRKVDIRSVVLRAQPGHRALIHLVWLNWCAGRPGPLNVAIRLPHMRGRLIGSFDGPPGYDFVPSCLSAQRASTLTLFTAYRR